MKQKKSKEKSQKAVPASRGHGTTKIKGVCVALLREVYEESSRKWRKPSVGFPKARRGQVKDH